MDSGRPNNRKRNHISGGEEEQANSALRRDDDEVQQLLLRRAARRMERREGQMEEERRGDIRRRSLAREQSALFPINEDEASDSVMLNRDEFLSDKLDRKMRNLNQLRRSSMVSGMKELWMEDRPHQRSEVGEMASLEKEFYQCLSAKTALILPFHWGDNHKSLNAWTDRMLKRTIVDKDTGKRINIWDSDVMLPFEVSELSAHFRQIVGWNEAVKRFLRRRDGDNSTNRTESYKDMSHSIAEAGEKLSQRNNATDKRKKAENKATKQLRKSASVLTAGIQKLRGKSDRKNGDEDKEFKSVDDDDKSEDDEEQFNARNCVLIDEGGEVEAEQEEESDSIANDLEVWKCHRLKLTKRAREILFPNPCIWASSNEAMLSPTQTREKGKHRRMSSSASTSEDDSSSEDEKEDFVETSKRPPRPLHSHSQPVLSRSKSEGLHYSSLEEDAAQPAGTTTSGDGPQAGALLLSNCKRKIGFEVEIHSVELVMYPLGCGLLVIHLNWMPGKLKDVPLTLDELRTWLFLVKFRHKVKKVFLGWTLGHEASKVAHGIIDEPGSQQNETGPFFLSHKRSLGRLAYSIYGDELVSLCTVGNWLLQLPHEDLTMPIRRISFGACANHHTTVVLNREPDEVDLREYLFHLTRAFGQRNRPPPLGLDESQNMDHILIHRLNRYIGVSREGTVALSWPTDPANKHFEVHTWPKLFQGVYLILCLHACVKRSHAIMP